MALVTADGPGARGDLATAVVNYSGAGACTVCGSVDWLCTDDPTWVGSATFVDPIPLGSWTITAVQVDVNGVLECSLLGGYSVTINGDAVGGVQVPVGAWCLCNGCEQETFTGTSLPSYVFGGTNTFMLNALNVGCITDADITITYETGCSDNDNDNHDDVACGGDDDDGGGGDGGSRGGRGCTSVHAAPTGGLSLILAAGLLA